MALTKIPGSLIEASDNLTITDLTVTGDLSITGDLNSYNVTDLDITDQTITLGAGQTEALSGGSGIVVDGSGASILWDETNDSWDFNKSIHIPGTSTLSTEFKIGNLTWNQNTASTHGLLHQLRKSDGYSELQINNTATAGAVTLSIRNDSTTVANINNDGGAYFAGDVGIGQTPTNRFDVTSSAIVVSKFKSSAGGSGARAIHSLSGNGNSVDGLVFISCGSTSTVEGGANAATIRNSENAPLIFGTNNTERMRIDSSGNVGIGTDTLAPLTKLHIATAGRPFTSTVDKSNGDMVGLVLTANTNQNTMNGIWFSSGADHTGTHWSGIAGSRSDYANTWGTHLSFFTHVDALSNITQATEKMRITSDGAITRSWDSNRYVKRDAKTFGSNFSNPSITIITVASSGNTNATIVIKVRVFQAVYASNTGNEHIGVATAMWTGSAWQFQAPTMTKTNGALTNIGTLSWSGNSLIYTSNRAGNYDNYYVDYEIFNQNPTNSSSQITYGF